MAMRRLLPICLSVVIVLAGMWLVIVAQDATTGSMAPIIETVRQDADSPGPVDGMAGIPGGGEVTVRAFVDGQELEGSPDHTMEGEDNEFHFDVPEGHAGGELRIEAMAADGTVTVKHIQINP